PAGRSLQRKPRCSRVRTQRTDGPSWRAPPQVPDARCGRLAPMQAEIATPRRATEPEELLEVASRVVEDARPGEQVEAVVTWSRDTEVRAHGGEVEHFVSSESAGVGVRVIADG